MSWYSSNYTHRWPILVDNLVASTAQIDVTFSIPQDLEAFWTTVQADGDDIRITDADGVTLELFELRSWTYATRTASIRLDNVTPPAQSCMFVVWLYWGYAAATTGSTVFVDVAPRSGYGYGPSIGSTILGAAPEAPGASRPRGRIAKKAGETLQPWVDLRRLLQRRRVKYNGSLAHEEVSYLIPSVYESTTDRTAQYDATRLRMVSDGIVRLHTTAGTTGTNYTLRCTVGTTEGSVMQPWWYLAIKDPTS